LSFSAVNCHIRFICYLAPGGTQRSEDISARAGSLEYACM
jgi:hypothetical protein